MTHAVQPQPRTHGSCALILDSCQCMSVGHNLPGAVPQLSVVHAGRLVSAGPWQGTSVSTEALTSRNHGSCRQLSPTPSTPNALCRARQLYLTDDTHSLNPRVRGSSPWRRTRTDLGFHCSKSFFMCPVCPHVCSMFARAHGPSNPRLVKTAHPVPLENRIRVLACGFVVASGGSAVFVDQPAQYGFSADSLAIEVDCWARGTSRSPPGIRWAMP